MKHSEHRVISQKIELFRTLHNHHCDNLRSHKAVFILKVLRKYALMNMHSVGSEDKLPSQLGMLVACCYEQPCSK
jgi:hypothetical protein